MDEIKQLCAGFLHRMLTSPVGIEHNLNIRHNARLYRLPEVVDIWEHQSVVGVVVVVGLVVGVVVVVGVMVVVVVGNSGIGSRGSGSKLAQLIPTYIYDGVFWLRKKRFLIDFGKIVIVI